MRTIACARSASRQCLEPGKGGGLLREGQDPVRVFEFMNANQAEFPIRVMARVLRVSASGYYAWCSRPASAQGRVEPRGVGERSSLSGWAAASGGHGGQADVGSVADGADGVPSRKWWEIRVTSSIACLAMRGVGRLTCWPARCGDDGQAPQARLGRRRRAVTKAVVPYTTIAICCGSNSIQTTSPNSWICRGGAEARRRRSLSAARTT